jgi:hypothetical protein
MSKGPGEMAHATLCANGHWQTGELYRDLLCATHDAMFLVLPWEKLGWHPQETESNERNNNCNTTRWVTEHRKVLSSKNTRLLVKDGN